MTASFHGNTHLYDAMAGVVMHGNVAVSTDAQGRSEIRIRNDVTKVECVLVFTSAAVRDCVLQFLDAAHAVYERVDMPVVLHSPLCPCCRGARQYEDAEGNWVPCRQCA